MCPVYFGSAALKVQVGVFGRGDLDDPGYLLNARVLVRLPSGLAIHAAFATELVEPETAPPAIYRDQLDIAVEYIKEGWTVRAEGVVVLDPPKDDAIYGAYVQLLYAAELSNGTQLEPGIHYGVATDVKGVLSHRGTLGLTWYPLGKYLNARVNYELRATEGDIGHAAYVQMQGGF
ncbi:MAG: hypothetical protein ACI9OJ_001575 [Myxococcota bacterium]|jgi:hypothetical protein